MRLGGLYKRVARWHEYLSPGEQQRVSFARLLCHATHPYLRRRARMERRAASHQSDFTPAADDETEINAHDSDSDRAQHSSKPGCLCCVRSSDRHAPLNDSDSENDQTDTAEPDTPLPVLAFLDEADAAVDAAGAQQLIAAAARGDSGAH